MFLQNQLEEADPTKKTSEQLIKENTDSQQMASVQSMFANPLRCVLLVLDASSYSLCLFLHL